MHKKRSIDAYTLSQIKQFSSLFLISHYSSSRTKSSRRHIDGQGSCCQDESRARVNLCVIMIQCFSGLHVISYPYSIGYIKTLFLLQYGNTQAYIVFREKKATTNELFYKISFLLELLSISIASSRKFVPLPSIRRNLFSADLFIISYHWHLKNLKEWKPLHGHLYKRLVSIFIFIALHWKF